MRTRMMAVVATLALFAVAGIFVLSSAVSMTIPMNDPHGIPMNDPHEVIPVFDLSSLTIPMNDPHCISSLLGLSGLTIPMNDPH